MRRLAKAKYIAPATHAVLYLAMWAFYWTTSRPLLDGPSGLLFLVLFAADFPISAYAFGVIFTSSEKGPMAALSWGLLGTFWWFLIGIIIDAAVRRFVNRGRAIRT